MTEKILYPIAFDADGNVPVVKKKKMELEAIKKAAEGAQNASDKAVNEAVNRLVKGKVKMVHEKENLTRENLIPFTNEDDALKYIFDKDTTPFHHISMPPLHNMTPDEQLCSHLNRTRGNIMNNSKAGKGNTIIYNPALKAKIESLQEQFGVDFEKRVEKIKKDVQEIEAANEKELEDLIGPSKGKNFFEHKNNAIDILSKRANEMEPDSLTYIECPHINEDRIFVMYRAPADRATEQPMYWVEGEGLLLNSVRVPVEMYGKFINLKERTHRRRGMRRMREE